MAGGLDVPDCSIRHKNSILVEAIYSIAERLLPSLVYPIAVLGVDTLPKIFASRQALPWIQSENSEHFLGAIEHLLGAGVPNPTARVRQLLRFSQIRLTSLELLLCHFLLDCGTSDVRDLVNDLLIPLGRSARLAIIDCERRNHFALRRENRCGPTGAQRMGQSQVTIVRPQRGGRDVLHNYRFAAVCGRPAGAG